MDDTGVHLVIEHLHPVVTDADDLDGAIIPELYKFFFRDIADQRAMACVFIISATFDA